MGSSDIYKKVGGLLKSGKKLTDIFDDIYSSGIKGIAVVELGGKMNLMNGRGDIISEDWVDIPEKWDGDVKTAKLHDERNANTLEIAIIGDVWNIISPVEKSLPFWPDFAGTLIKLQIWDMNLGFNGVGSFDGVIKRDGFYGYVDKNYKLVIPCEYDFLNIGDDGYIRVKNELGNYGLFDTTGTMIIPCKYSAINRIGTNPQILNGELKGLFRVIKNDRYIGFIDTKGNEVIPCKYTYIGSWIKDYAPASTDNWCGYIDKNGNRYKDENGIPRGNDKVTESVSGNGNDDVYKEAERRLKSGENFVDIFDDIYSSGIKGVAVVELEGKTNLIDRDNRIIMDEWIHTDNDKNKEYTFLNTCKGIDRRTGLEITIAFSNNGQKGGVWNIITKSGPVMPFWADISSTMEMFTRYRRDVLFDGVLSKHEKMGYVDEKYNILIPCVYDCLEIYFSPTPSSNNKWEPRIIFLKNGGKRGIANPHTGKLIVPCVYDVVNIVGRKFGTVGMVLVGLDKKWGVIRLDGKTIVPCVYDNVEFPELESESWIVATKGDDSVYFDMDGNKMDVSKNIQLKESVSDNGNDDVYKEAERKLKSGKSLLEIFDDVYSSGIKGVAVVELGGKMNLLDRNGKLLMDEWVGVPKKQEEAEIKFSEFTDERTGEVVKYITFANLYNVYYGGELKFKKWMYIIRNTGVVGNGYAYGYADDKWNLVIPCKYDYVGTIRTYDESETDFVVVRNVGTKREYGIMDTKGNVVAPIKYEGIFGFDNRPSGYLKVERNGKRGILDIWTGKEAIPCEYVNIGDWEYRRGGRYASASTDNWIGFIDEKGNKYDEVDGVLIRKN